MSAFPALHIISDTQCIKCRDKHTIKHRLCPNHAHLSCLKQSVPPNSNCLCFTHVWPCYPREQTVPWYPFSLTESLLRTELFSYIIKSVTIRGRTACYNFQDGINDSWEKNNPVRLCSCHLEAKITTHITGTNTYKFIIVKTKCPHCDFFEKTGSAHCLSRELKAIQWQREICKKTRFKYAS